MKNEACVRDEACIYESGIPYRVFNLPKERAHLSVLSKHVLVPGARVQPHLIPKWIRDAELEFTQGGSFVEAAKSGYSVE